MFLHKKYTLKNSSSSDAFGGANIPHLVLLLAYWVKNNVWGVLRVRASEC